MNLQTLKKRLQKEIEKTNEQIELLKAKERKCHQAIGDLNCGNYTFAKELLIELSL